MIRTAINMTISLTPLRDILKLIGWVRPAARTSTEAANLFKRNDGYGVLKLCQKRIYIRKRASISKP
jgi:hypothetical protein